MATVYANGLGQYSIQFATQPKKRGTIYLGKVPRRFAEEFCRRIESLVECRHVGRLPNGVTRQWLTELAPKFKRKLVRQGLADGEPVTTIDQLCAYCVEQADVQPSTRQVYSDARANLVSFFGTGRPIQGITPGDADEFRQWLKAKGRRSHEGPLALGTVSKRCQMAKQFFGAAVRKRWILENPFHGQKGGSSANRDRMHFVDRAAIEALVHHATPEMKLIIALARYAGVRTPSEVFPLEWGWVDWDAGVLNVYSPKMKRFEHKRWRKVPLFPELRATLAEAWEAAPEGATHVVTSSGLTPAGLRKRLMRLCLRAGVKPWAKPWQNMRSTRETELLEDYPIHVVTQWMGNTPAVAIKHYGQVTAEHVARATCREAMETAAG